jgi:tetratricopeptide (TPR) repeat protein
MKKRFTHIVLLLLASVAGFAQNRQRIDSLKREFEISQNDTVKMVCLLHIAEEFDEPKPDSAYYYANQELILAKKLNIRLSEALALNGIAYAFKNMGNYPASLQTYLSANEILSDASIEETMLPGKYYNYSGFDKPITGHMIRMLILGFNQLGLGLLYETTNNYDMALFYDLQAKRSFEEADNSNRVNFINMILGRTYLSLNKPDSALIFLRAAHDLAIQMNLDGSLPSILLNLGRTYLEMGNQPLAKEYFLRAAKKSREQGYLRGQIAADLLLYDAYQQEGKKDSSSYFVNEALRVAQYQNAPDLLLRTYTALAAFYSSSGKNDSTVKYQSLIIAMKDSLFGTKQAQQFQAVDIDYKQRRMEIEAAEKNYRDRLQMYGMLAGLAMLLVVAIILWQSNRHKQQAYLLLQNQKQETDFQKKKLKKH